MVEIFLINGRVFKGRTYLKEGQFIRSKYEHSQTHIPVNQHNKYNPINKNQGIILFSFTFY